MSSLLSSCCSPILFCFSFLFLFSGQAVSADLQESGEIRFSMSDNTCLPSYATNGSAGADLRACIRESVVIKPGERKVIDTGIESMQFPANLMPAVLSRAGLGMEGIQVDFISRVDPDYTGPLLIPLKNTSDSAFTVKPGMRIAQLIFFNVERPQLVNDPEIKNRKAESRGQSGRGSTGLN